MNIAVFLPNWIGDAVMATPALRALRRYFGNAHMIGVMKPYVAGVLEGGDWFDRVLLAHGGGWTQGVAATAWKLHRERIDLTILFPNSFRCALTAFLGGSRRIVGYGRYGRSPLLTDALEPDRLPDGQLRVSPIVDAYNRLVEHVGCVQPGYDLELFTTPADEAAADRVWELAGMEYYPEVVCLNPGAAFGAAKHWPSEYFASLARHLHVQRGCGVLILCGPAERDLAKEIAERADLPAVTSLGEMVERGGPKLGTGIDQGVRPPGRSAGDDRQWPAPFCSRL